MHTRSTFKGVITMDLNNILNSVNTMASAKTAKAADVTAKYNEAISIQNTRNAQYDKMLEALQKGKDALSESDAKNLLADNGFTKIEMTNAYKNNLKSSIQEAMDAEAEAKYRSNLKDVLELSKEIAAIERANTPESPFDTYMRYKTYQEFGSSNPTAPQVPQQPTTTSFDYRKIEAENAARERDAKIAEYQRLKKDGGLNMVECAQLISQAKGEYTTTIKNLYK